MLPRSAAEQRLSDSCRHEASCGKLLDVWSTQSKAHQDDEGENVAHRHGVHVAKLRHTSVDPSDVVRAGFRGFIGEHKTLLKTTGEELVRDGGTCQGVQEKNFGPGI